MEVEINVAQCVILTWTKISISTSIMMRHHQQECRHVCKTANLVWCPHPGWPSFPSLAVCLAVLQAMGKVARAWTMLVYSLVWPNWLKGSIMQTWCSCDNAQETCTVAMWYIYYSAQFNCCCIHTLSPHTHSYALGKLNIRPNFYELVGHTSFYYWHPNSCKLGIRYTEGNLNR